MLSRPSWWFTGAIVWGCVLYWLSSRSLPEMPGPEIPHFDKILHASYFTLGSTMVLVGVRLRWPGKPWWGAALAAILFAALVGAADEYHQSHVPGRSGNDRHDWMADVVGGFIACAMGPLVHRFVRTKPLVVRSESR